MQPIQQFLNTAQKLNVKVTFSVNNISVLCLKLYLWKH